MQILQPFAGSIQRYLDEIADTDRYRPDHCPQCGAKHPLTGHGVYFRSLVDTAFDGFIRVRRYLKQATALSLALVPLVTPSHPRDPAAEFVSIALRMLEAIGWIAAHRFLFSQLRVHLLGWPACLVPAGRRITLAAECSAP